MKLLSLFVVLTATISQASAQEGVRPAPENLPDVSAISHASAVVEWNDVTIKEVLKRV